MPGLSSSQEVVLGQTLQSGPHPSPEGSAETLTATILDSLHMNPAEIRQADEGDLDSLVAIVVEAVENIPPAIIKVKIRALIRGAPRREDAEDADRRAYLHSRDEGEENRRTRLHPIEPRSRVRSEWSAASGHEGIESQLDVEKLSIPGGTVYGGHIDALNRCISFWVSEVADTASLRQLNPIQTFLYVYRCLSGDVRRSLRYKLAEDGLWIVGLGEKERALRRLEAAERLLKEEYKATDDHRTVRNKLQQLVQGDSSLDTYASRFESLLAEARCCAYNEGELSFVARFREGLAPRLKEASNLISPSCTSVAELVHHIRQYQLNASATVAVAVKSIRMGKPLCRYYANKGSCRYGEGCRFSHERAKEDGTLKPSNERRDKASASGQPRLCLICNGPNHLAKDCPRRAEVQSFLNPVKAQVETLGAKACRLKVMVNEARASPIVAEGAPGVPGTLHLKVCGEIKVPVLVWGHTGVTGVEALEDSGAGCCLASEAFLEELRSLGIPLLVGRLDHAIDVNYAGGGSVLSNKVVAIRVTYPTAQNATEDLTFLVVPTLEPDFILGAPVVTAHDFEELRGPRIRDGQLAEDPSVGVRKAAVTSADGDVSCGVHPLEPPQVPRNEDQPPSTSNDPLAGSRRDTMKPLFSILETKQGKRLQVNFPFWETADVLPRTEPPRPRNITDTGILGHLVTQMLQKGWLETVPIAEVALVNEVVICDKWKDTDKFRPRAFPLAEDEASRYRLTMDMVPTNRLTYCPERNVWYVPHSPSRTQHEQGYPSVLSQLKDWDPAIMKVYGKLDISNCFHNLQMPEGLRRLCGLVHKGQCYRYTALPQGWRYSPVVFDRGMSWLMQEGVCVVNPTFEGRWRAMNFHDDILVSADDPMVCSHVMEVLTAKLREFGMEVHPDKTVGPCTTLTFCGYRLEPLGRAWPCPARRSMKSAAINLALQKLEATTDRSGLLRQLKSWSGVFNFFSKWLGPEQRNIVREFNEAIKYLQSPDSDHRLLDRGPLKRGLTVMASYYLDSMPALVPTGKSLASIVVCDANIGSWASALLSLSTEPSFDPVDFPFQPLVENLRRYLGISATIPLGLHLTRLDGQTFGAVDQRRSSTCRERLAAARAVSRNKDALLYPCFVISDNENVSKQWSDLSAFLTSSGITAYEDLCAYSHGFIHVSRKHPTMSLLDGLARSLLLRECLPPGEEVVSAQYSPPALGNPLGALEAAIGKKDIEETVGVGGVITRSQAKAKEGDAKKGVRKTVQKSKEPQTSVSRKPPEDEPAHGTGGHIADMHDEAEIKVETDGARFDDLPDVEIEHSGSYAHTVTESAENIDARSATGENDMEIQEHHHDGNGGAEGEVDHHNDGEVEGEDNSPTQKDHQPTDAIKALRVLHEFGHGGVGALFDLAKRKELAVTKDLAARIVSECSGCLLGKVSSGKGVRGHLPESSGVGRLVYVDFSDLLPLEKKLVLYVDAFSRLVYADLVTGPTSSEVTRTLSNFMSILGPVGVLVSDNTRAFDGGDLRRLLSRYGVTQAHIAVYNPQGNLAERYIRTAKEALRCSVLNELDIDTATSQEAEEAVRKNLPGVLARMNFSSSGSSPRPCPADVAFDFDLQVPLLESKAQKPEFLGKFKVGDRVLVRSGGGPKLAYSRLPIQRVGDFGTCRLKRLPRGRRTPSTYESPPRSTQTRERRVETHTHKKKKKIKKKKKKLRWNQLR